MTSPVRDNPALRRYEMELEGGTAVANYRLDGGVITFTHTEVPRSIREKGIGSQLVRGMLEDARARGLRVRPLCSFVGHFIAHHPEFQDLLA